MFQLPRPLLWEQMAIALNTPIVNFIKAANERTGH